MADHKSFMNTQELCGIKISSKVKYLGLTLSLNKQEIVKDAKNQIKRYLNGIRNKLWKCKEDVKELLFTSYIRSLIVYYMTSLKAAGMISLDKISGYETHLRRLFLRYPHDIKAKAIHNVTDLYKRSISEVIQELVVEINKQICTQQSLSFQDSSTKEDEAGDIEAEKLKYLKKPKLFLSKDVKDLMLAVSKGSSCIHYNYKHYCIEHQKFVDFQHLKQCSLMSDLANIGGFRDTIAHEKLSDMKREKLVDVLVFFGRLWWRIR